ncbi:MAG: transporter substrate-binding domain-containing protein [Acholeplasmatales bacterium]|jgi:ABC-type amino acid transport substrate-binding protein|nr:transporter substrate-binding domain-containing protein [Acholeplasmatales bacterium]
MKKILVLLLGMSVLFFLNSCVESKNEEELVVGLEASYPPFNFTELEKTESNVEIANLEGAYVDGYDVQIAKIIASSLKRKLVIKQIVWEALVLALNNKEIDLIIAGMSPTEDRKQEVSFSSAYYTSTHVAIVLNNSKLKGATTLEAFANKTGVGQIETIYATLVQSLSVPPYNCTVLPVMDTVPLIINAILNGVADFTIVEKPVALGYIINNPNLALALDVNPSINLFNVGESDRDVSIAVRKSETSLLKEINKILSSLSLDVRNHLMDAAINKSSKE